uniref:Gag-pol polyprotein n=1 Tax=Solanum tuberosum TaxID=4113 RepID=M1DK07_SOLTU
MLIGYMGIGRLMIHVQQVKKNQLKDREEFENKRAKTSGNESGQQNSNANRSSFQHKQNGPALSSASALVLRNKGVVGPTQVSVVMASQVVSSVGKRVTL